MNKQHAGKLFRTFGLAVVTIAIVFAFSPSLRNGIGSVDPPDKRPAAGELQGVQLNGDSWSLTSEKGKVVLVNLWATWCPPCRAETPDLVRLHERYRSQGFTVAGVTMDEDPAKAVPGFAKQYKISYPIVVPQESSALVDSTDVLPSSFLIDQHGRVARRYTGMVSEKGLADDIEALLREDRKN